MTPAATYTDGPSWSLTRIVLVLLCALGLGSGLYAETTAQLFDAANTAYKNKDYDLAIAGYDKLLSQGYRTAEIYYNLGDAFYKKDSIGQAILCYERALRLAPGDEDITFNLKLANQKTVDRLIPVPQLAIVQRWDHFVEARSSRTWSILAGVCVWLALAGFAAYLFVQSIRRLGFYFGVVLLLCAGFFGSLAWSQSHAETGADQAILTTDNAYIKSAPDASSTDLFMIHEGIKLRILDHVGEWSKVRLADGKVGWVQQATYTVI
ncbi:MAG: tetratricopeptide repeat protein [Bacteroidetes bacterium]|nr:tetratricopeptide repeat protein [Bacteroidota bacterium]